MSTWQCLVTVLTDHILALLSQTDICKCVVSILYLLVLVSQRLSTESALLRIQVPVILITVLSSVVRLHVAPMTESILTSWTPDPKLTHMDGGLR